jgi:hypothetical protein
MNRILLTNNKKTINYEKNNIFNSLYDVIDDIM